jgi:hypothetical protein
MRTEVDVRDKSSSSRRRMSVAGQSLPRHGCETVLSKHIDTRSQGGNVLFSCMKLTHESCVRISSCSLQDVKVKVWQDFRRRQKRGMCCCWIRGVERSIKLMFPDSIVNRKKEERGTSKSVKAHSTPVVFMQKLYS